MTWNRALIGLLVVVVLLAGGLFTYSRFFAPQNDSTSADAVASSNTTPSSTLLPSTPSPLPTGAVTAEGRLLPLRHATLAFSGGGLLAEAPAAEGAAVRAGDPLLRLDDADQQAALLAAQAGVALAPAERDTAAATVADAVVAAGMAELDVQAAAARLALASAAPRAQEIALAEASLALADAQLAAAAAAQSLLLEGAGDAATRAAEAELRAAEATAVPARLRLDQAREAGDDDAIAEAQRAYDATQAAIAAAQAALDAAIAGPTAAQRDAAAGGVAAATAGRAAAAAELDLLLAGGAAETVTAARAAQTAANAALAQAMARQTAAESALAGAEAAIHSAAAAQTAAEAALRDRTLIAPFDGTVTDSLFVPGEFVPPGAPAVVVADLSGWQVETTDLVERDAVRVAVGAAAAARPDPLPGVTLPGAVSDVGRLAQDAQGDTAYPVTIRLDPAAAAGQPLRWGMTVFVTIDVGGTSSSTLPSTEDGGTGSSTLRTVTAEGVLLPAQTADLAFAAGGPVSARPAAEGQAVNAGEALIALDDAAARAALAQAEADLLAAEAGQTAARAQLELAEGGRRAANAALAVAEAEQAGARAGARPEEILAAEQRLAAAEAELAGARADRAATVAVSDAHVRAAEAALSAALADLTTRQQVYEEILTTCVKLPDGGEACPLLGPPEETARAALAAAEVAYAAAQLALEEAQAGATAGQTAAADAAVAVAAARRDMAAAQLALLRAGPRPEQLELAGIAVAQAGWGQEQAGAATTQAEAAVARADANVQSATARRDAVQNALDRLTLAAPFGGAAAELLPEVGEQVAPGVVAARFGSTDGWIVETTDLVELDAPFVRAGQAATVTLDALPGETLRGTVVDVALSPGEARGDVVYRVRVALDDAGDLPLRWGMTAVVTIEP